MSKIDSSIILITTSQIVRADFAGRNASRLVAFAKDQRAPGSNFDEALETGLAVQKSVGRRTLVLDTTIWSQLVSVPRLSVLDVNPDELNNALKFEVETLSGVDADQAVLGICPVDSIIVGAEQDQAFWVNVATKDNFELATRRLKSLGAKWIGLAHPAGLILNRNQSKQKQIELWGNLVVLLDRTEIKSIASASGHWHQHFGFETWDQVRDQAAIIAESDDALPEELDGCEFLSLEQDASAKKWLQSIARQVAKQEMDSRPIVVRSQEGASSARKSLFRRVALVLLISSFCFAHYYFLKQRTRVSETQLTALKQPAIQKRNYDSQLTQVQQERSKLEQDAADIQGQGKQIEFLFDRQTGRLEQFLDLLLNSRTNDLVIEEIAHHEKGVVVKGFSLGGNSAPLMATKLRELAIPLGWRIHAPTQIGEQKMVSGGPWQFSILFEDVGPGQPPTSVGPSPEPLRNNVAKDNEVF